MSGFYLSIDQGTTSSRAILFSEEGQIHGKAQQEFSQQFPQNGWVEHDPNDIWNSVLSTCTKVITDTEVDIKQIRAIGITNQRETTIVWDRFTGKPIYNAIVWQDRRTAAYCESINSPQVQSLISNKTGLLLDSYFSATKVRWILENVEGAREKAERGELVFGTVDSYLLWQLTSGKSHFTDATNASRTMLFNIHDQCWDEELLSMFSIPKSMLPEVKDSADDFGSTEFSVFNRSIPICGIAGDQQAALIGQACFLPGMAKSTYGTGCFVMQNTGNQPLKSNNKLLTTVAYRLNGKVTYAIEGSIFMAGATVQWLRDGLKIISQASECDGLANSIPHDHGVYMVPAFTGLGAPYWNSDARGAILGLTRDSGVQEIATAALQSVCYQTKDLQLAMENDGLKPNVLRVDGGMSSSDWTLTFLSDLLNVTVERPEVTETSALGVAYLAGLQIGSFQDTNDIADLWSSNRVFKPTISEELREKLYSGWLQAVCKVMHETNS
ncbi:glycerol kinase GlpK [Aliiglaciecola sp. 3_MG-2023]|uniref:glycerol kinase GlpK n=1 Tax=Aliiglaciecola sp. 3_MG-2023 TaxID=3062644 RepID=UPI0026E20E54|nr:glycerol kinase GlpK [Aliiglaciecola sp. 3_MG-2023]MDO6692814.1 glycerol kinase GlpK [Aliiglaciecola sp. 3_MG-2023]